MASSNDHPFFDMFARFGESLAMPRVDVEQVLDSHRRNIEALERSAKAAAAGTATLMNKQREVMEQGLRDAAEMAQAFRAPGTPQEMAGKGTDWARRSFEAAVKNAGEMAEILRQSGTESTEILRERIRQSMDEAIRGMTPKK
ncbi:MAG TPA: TIGR01841 family phasin [Mesorhizobium sp.]|jgi:phasin family protein|nr:TIGR01841 family phasin [Mesorhizobium sp.]